MLSPMVKPGTALTETESHFVELTIRLDETLTRVRPNTEDLLMRVRGYIHEEEASGGEISNVERWQALNNERMQLESELEKEHKATPEGLADQALSCVESIPISQAQYLISSPAFLNFESWVLSEPFSKRVSSSITAKLRYRIWKLQHNATQAPSIGWPRLEAVAKVAGRLVPLIISLGLTTAGIEDARTNMLPFAEPWHFLSAALAALGVAVPGIGSKSKEGG